MGIIEQADRIVGIDNKISLWCRADQDIYRRGAYFKWIGTKDSRGVRYGADLEIIAAEVVRIHAEEEKSKQPDDGLPPGPWGIYIEDTATSTWLHVSLPIGAPRKQADVMKDYIARCGSPAVRRLLATFEVTEELVNGDSIDIRINEYGHAVTAAYHGLPEKTPCSTRVCWLTPRSNP